MNHHDSSAKPEKMRSGIEDEITIMDIILKIQGWVAILWRKRFLIVSFSLMVGLSAALFIKFIAIPTYTASYELFFPQKGGGMSSAMRLASSFGLSLGGSGSTSSITVKEFLTSRDNMEKALVTNLENGLLINRYYANELKKDAEFAEEFPTKFGINQRYTDSVITRVTSELNNRNVTTSLDKKTDLLSVIINGKNESFVYDLGKLLILNTENTFIDYHRKKSETAVNSFQLKVDSLELLIDVTLRRLGEYQDQNNSLVSSVDKMKSMRLSIDLEVLKLSYGEYIKGLEMSKADLISLEPPFKYFDAPTYPLRKEKSSAAMAGIIGTIITGFLLVLFFIGRFEFRKMISDN